MPAGAYTGGAGDRPVYGRQEAHKHKNQAAGLVYFYGISPGGRQRPATPFLHQVMQSHQDSRKRGATGRQGRHNITNSNIRRRPVKNARIAGNTAGGIGIFVSVGYLFTFL